MKGSTVLEEFAKAKRAVINERAEGTSEEEMGELIDRVVLFALASIKLTDQDASSVMREASPSKLGGYTHPVDVGNDLKELARSVGRSLLTRPAPAIYEDNRVGKSPDPRD